MQGWCEGTKETAHYPNPSSISEKDNPGPSLVKEKPLPQKVTLYAKKLIPTYAKLLLSDATDVEQYVEAFKVVLLAELKKGNTILV